MQNARHVVVVMNGTARWAAGNGRSLPEAQRASLDAARAIAVAAAAAKVRFLTLCGEYAELPSYPQNPTSPAPPSLPPRTAAAAAAGSEVSAAAEGGHEALAALCRELLPSGGELVVTLRLGQSGRRDIAAAVRKLATAVQAGRLDPALLDESLLRAALCTEALPDPDLILYTGCLPGEHRLRDDLIFESAYAEFFFSQRLWPDFGPKDFLFSLSDFAGRQRRFGKTAEQVSPGEPGAGRYCVASSSIGS